MSIYYGSKKVSGSGGGNAQYVKLTKSEYDLKKAKGELDPSVMYCTTDEIDQFDLGSLSAEVWSFYVSGKTTPIQKKVIIQG